MIALDTSALTAIVLQEDTASACIAVLEAERERVISAATLAEALVVSQRRGFGHLMVQLLDGIVFDAVPVDAAFAQRVADAYSRWGRGMHPAALNFGDCFAYVAAKDHSCPLLYVGNDFTKTDIESALK